jgi:hypothetical protein
VRQERLREALKAAYLDGRSKDGPRGFESVAWAVQGIA